MIWQGKLLFFSYLFIYSFLSQAVKGLIARTLHQSLVDVPIVRDGLVTFCGEEANSETVVSIKRFQFNVSWNLSFGPLSSYNQKVLHMPETRSAKAFDKFLAGYPCFKSRLSASPCLWATCTFKSRNSLLHKTVLTAFVFCC